VIAFARASCGEGDLSWGLGIFDSPHDKATVRSHEREGSGILLPQRLLSREKILLVWGVMIGFRFLSP
jgi:hypothetical protein